MHNKCPGELRTISYDKKIRSLVKLFEAAQGVLLSHLVKVVKSVRGDRDLSEKCHR